MRSHSYLNTAKDILIAYEGQVPLAIWLKQYFKTQKKFGSTDRKQISNLCFSYYRLGSSFSHLDTATRLLTGLFLCTVTTQLVIHELMPEWEHHAALSIEKKLALLGAAHELSIIFPLANFLSPEMERLNFNKSLLIQPSMFLRMRPGHQEQIKTKLHQAGIVFLLTNDCIELPVGTPVDQIIRLDEEAVVQDFNSQKVVQLLTGRLDPLEKFTIWDCCAASGGKSILFHDHFPNATLVVSDIRESILVNLRKRFQRAGIHHYKMALTDLSTEVISMDQQFGLVICDAPCSGSGTWSRTPEQMHFFTEKKLDDYAVLQRKIVRNAVKQVQAGGFFLYITCSVFAIENEAVVEYIKNELSLECLETVYFKGYEQKADTLFAALFTV